LLKLTHVPLAIAILLVYFLFFSRRTFSDVGKPTSLKLSRTELCYTDFTEVPLKEMGAEKAKVYTIFACQIANN